MERAGVKVEFRDEIPKSTTAGAIRCAKVAFMLSSLKSFHIRRLTATVDQQSQEKKELMKALGDLKVELTRERLKNKKIKLCGLMEFILELVLLLAVSFSSFVFLIAFKYI